MSSKNKSPQATQDSKRRVWSDRKWQWPGDCTSPTASSSDLFRRSAANGMLQFIIECDQFGSSLDGSKMHRLSLPQPVPARRFWSISVFDAGELGFTDVREDQSAFRSRFELTGGTASSSLDLFFGPNPPAGRERDWIETGAGTRWFARLCIYGPDCAAFDGSWKPGDLEEISLSPARRT